MIPFLPYGFQNDPYAVPVPAIDGTGKPIDVTWRADDSAANGDGSTQADFITIQNNGNQDLLVQWKGKSGGTFVTILKGNSAGLWANTKALWLKAKAGSFLAGEIEILCTAIVAGAGK